MKNVNNKQYSLPTLFGFLAVLVTLLGLSACATKPPNIQIPKVAPKPREISNVRVAMVLGSGGSRALVHLGVLEVLEAEGVPIDLIVGSSGGSMMGALYADNPNSAAIKEKVMKLKREDLIDPYLAGLLMSPWSVSAPVQGNALQRFLLKELKAKDFKDLKIPLVAVATNIDNHSLVMLRSGPIAPAIHASSALPPVFAPVNLYQQNLVDGGVIAPVPVAVAKFFKPKLVIAVDISTPPSEHTLSNTIDLVYRSLHITFFELSRMQSRQADIYMHPDLMGYGTFEDHRNIELFEKGREMARVALPKIKSALARRGISLRPKAKRGVRPRLQTAKGIDDHNKSY